VRPHHYRLLASAAVLGALLTGTFPAQAQSAQTPNGTHVDSNGFYVWDHEPFTLQHAHTFVVQGVRSDHGCVFTSGVQLNSATPRLAQQQLGVNPESCQEILSQGLPDGPWHGTVPTPSSGKPGSPTPDILPCGSSTAHAFQKYYDPANITVTSQTTYLTWYYNGSYLCGTAYGSVSPYGFYDGWYLEPGYCDCTWTDQSSAYYAAEKSGNYYWENDFWCEQFGCYGGSTYTAYYWNIIYGNQYGQINAYQTYSAWGGDSGLLHWYGDWCYGTGRC